MVFESIVVDLLNRYLGDYVENLDKNQLKIGIWGGDVVLENLLLKQSALDELDLPIQTTYGRLGKLVLKIPWKNLYKSSVEVIIENLYLLSSPNKVVPYDDLKENKKAFEAKQAELKRIEEAKKKESETNTTPINKTFAEKLVTQIINNIQIKIKNIHIRFEDETSATKPFALGVSLSEFTALTVDKDGFQTLATEDISQVFKKVTLEGLSVYLNCNSSLFLKQNQNDLPNMFCNNIASSNFKPSQYNYVLGPISSSCKLEINPDPLLNQFSIPKLIVNATMEKLSVGLQKSQYQDLLQITMNMDRMKRGLPYRKYRPFNIPYKGNATVWWKYAIDCVLVDVQRIKNNWNWNHMIQHRNNIREYARVYKKLQESKKKPADLIATCTDFEKKIDVLNLVMVRQKIDLEIQKETTNDQLEQKSSGWFSGWFGGTKTQSGEQTSDMDIKKQVKAAMTSDEKEKLYRAIGYQENDTPAELPESYIATNLEFVLKALEIVIKNDEISSESDLDQILFLQLKNVTCNIAQRPGAAALRLQLAMHSFTVYGKHQDNLLPILAKSNLGKDNAILNIMFETNPIDKACDQRVIVNSRPLQIVYDAETINELIAMFTPPSDINVTPIQDVTGNTLNNFSERSATGMQYLIEKHNKIELNIHLMPTYLIIPFKGLYLRNESPIIIIDMGNLSIQSEPRSFTKDVATMASAGADANDILNEMINQSYDRFKCSIYDMQVLVAKSYENWFDARSCDIKTEMHLLKPFSCSVSVHLCVIGDDPRLPKTKISSEIPAIKLNVSEDRILKVLEIVSSIPLPVSNEIKPMPLKKENALISSSKSLLKFLEDKPKRAYKNTPSNVNLHEEITQYTDLMVEFVMKEFTFVVYKPKIQCTTPSSEYRTPDEEFKSEDLKQQSPIALNTDQDNIILFVVKQLEATMIQRTYDMKVSLKLGSIGLNHFTLDKNIHMISTPKFDNEKEYLFTVNYIIVKLSSPEFTTVYNSIEQLAEIDFSTLVLVLNQEGLVTLMQMATDFQTKLDNITKNNVTTGDRIATAQTEPFLSAVKDKLPTIVEETHLSTNSTLHSSKISADIVQSVKMKIIAKLERVSVEIENDKRSIVALSIQNLLSSVITKSSHTEISLMLRDIYVLDKNPQSIHKTIMSVMGGNAIQFQLVLFNRDATRTYNSDDMKVDLSIGCIKIVFLNWFVQTILGFLDHFQAAQQTIAHAGAAAAETAKINMVNAYENATRIQMNIRLKAPIIIVPLDSKTNEGICLDLGYLSITNNNTELPALNEIGENAVIDEMKIELKNLRLFKVTIRHEDNAQNFNTSSNNNASTLDISFGTHSDVNILTPLSCAFFIQRNLSATWYKEAPELNISGRLKNVELQLVKDDFKLLMDILSKNMVEGADERPSNVISQVKLKENEDNTEIKSNHSVQKTVSTVNSQNNTTFENTKQIDTFLKFDFQLDSIIINLMNTSSEGLACFGVHYVSLKGNKLVDESLSTSIILCDMQLEDARPNRENKITRFITRHGSEKDSTGASTSSMIDVIYNQNNNDIFLEMRVKSFDLILSIDFLDKIKYFFHIPELDNVEEQSTIVAAPSVIKHTDNESHVVVSPVAENKHITVILNIEKPEIILVEQMDDINCNALIFNTELSMRFRMIGERQVIKGDILNFNMYMSEFNPNRRELTRNDVIYPCSLSLNGSTPDGKGLHVSLNVTDIKICVTPAIIELLNKAMVTLTSQERKVTVVNTIVNYEKIWNLSDYHENDYWFFQPTTIAEDVLQTQIVEVEHKVELCIAEVPSIIIIIETGCGYQTIPMLIIETNIQANIHNWSSQMSIESYLRLSMSYYNTSLALWEPIIEPNQRECSNGLLEYGPWELSFALNIEKNDDNEMDEPTTKICVSSKDVLELTVTKTCLDVLQNLGSAFSEAIKSEGLAKPAIDASYVVQNDTGVELTLNLVESDFLLHNCHLSISGYVMDEHVSKSVIFKNQPNNVSAHIASEVTVVTISPGGKAYLQLKNKSKTSLNTNVTNLSGKAAEEKFLNVQVGNIEKEIILPVHRADARYFPLYRDTKQEPWGLVSDISVEYGCTVINVHGVVQVMNNFSTPISVYRKKDGSFQNIGEVKPNAIYNIPLHAIYASEKELYFSLPGYKMSVQGISWKENPSDFKLIRTIQCDPTSTFEPFYINAVRERKEIFYEVTSKYTMLSACYVVHLRPPLILKNSLPIGLRVSVAGCTVNVKDTLQHKPKEEPDFVKKERKADFLDYGEKLVKPGEAIHLPTIKTSSKNDTSSYIVARIVQYLEKDWSCTTEIPSIMPEYSVWVFNSYDSVEVMTLVLGVRYENRNGTYILSVYSPFWMVNKTGLMLSYRPSDESANVLYHPPDYNGPILFSFREKAFFGKKKASVRIDTGEWSDKFSIDVAGSSGVVECNANGMTYQIAVHNTLTHNSLTKQIMFMPYYILLNKAPFTIEVQEDQRPGDPWLFVKSEESIPFWPKILTNKMMRLRTAADSSVANSFNYTDVQNTLLKLDNNYGGIHVDVHVTEGGIFISFNCYYPGDAPALIINHTNEEISFWEKGNINERTVPPQQKLLYTWVDPTGERKIIWNDSKSKNKIENDLKRDGVDEFNLSNNKSAFWVSFLNGTQRILLFTDNQAIANTAETTNQLEKVNQEILIEIHGIGFSLVNNVTQSDIMYIGIASSGVIWEECKKKNRFKPMKIQESLSVEEKYQEYLRDRVLGKDNETLYFIDEKIQIFFPQMIIKKNVERPIRRIFYPGLWLDMKSSPYQQQIHAKINRIQIDNQTTDCIFPVVLAPVPPPKSVAATTELKPFVECSIVERIIPHSDVKQYKYLRVLMQEFHIKVDLMFINELFEFLNTEIPDEESEKQFNQDLSYIKKPLSAHVEAQSQQEKKNFYDQLHLGPLKIHISFSMAGSESQALPGILSTILQGVGVTLTDINDVVFRLAFFEKEFCFLTQQQLVSECISHYSGQAVKQLYVLVLGLDVIGNPYGLVVGITKGVEDLFYEPFQGAIQGPGEFAEGLALGVKSLFGHTVGGAAGAVSKITGAMGQGLAALTFDKDYQRKRRNSLTKRPTNLREGLARSGKGLVTGVADGITGVFTKPITGAKSDGVEGFFKGLGKGAVGLVARPTAGLVDFASGTFESVKRATEVGEGVERLRSPRFLHSDGIVRPFNKQEAEGNKLFKEIEKGKYSNTDTFAHFEIIIDKHEVVLLTDHRIIYLIKNDLFGGWQIEWIHRWNEIVKISENNRGVEILLDTKEPKKGIGGFFGSSKQTKKVILIEVKTRREMLTRVMIDLKNNSQ